MSQTPPPSSTTPSTSAGPSSRRKRLRLRTGRRVRRVSPRRLRQRLRTLLLPVLALAVLASAVAAVAWQAGIFKPRAVPVFALGEQYDGDALSAKHPLARHHNQLLTVSAAAPAAPDAAPDLLALRRSCVWGKPGGNPYRGSVEQALRSAALPEEVVQSVVAQVRAGQPVDRL